MIELKIDTIGGGCAEFKCPLCGVTDAVCVQTPEECWNCCSPYEFNIHSLESCVDERAYYHFHVTTSDYNGY